MSGCWCLHVPQRQGVMYWRCHCWSRDERRILMQIAAALITWETARKAREDEAKAKKDAAAKRAIQELHERHLGAEQVGKFRGLRLV